MKAHCRIPLGILAALVLACSIQPDPAFGQAPQTQATDETALWNAICPIIYPVDQSASERGYHYLFYGNGFLINAEGYLITAAHVLSQLHGGQPYVLLHQSSSEFRIASANLVAIDREHDVAVLRVTPNPFAGHFQVSFLPLSADRPQAGDSVLAAALLPSKPREAYTLNATIEMRVRGEVLDSEFSQLEKGKGDTELLLFSHEVALGQSGAPIISASSRKVIGLVEGQWFGRQTLAMAAADSHALGAILPVHYAIALLQQKHIAWHSDSADSEAQPSRGSSPNPAAPVPLSLVPAAYPSQSMFGGEVLLDALVNTSGILTDVKTVRGESPFLEKTLVALRTWTFLPASTGSPVAENRIGVAFEFIPRLNVASKSSKPENEATPSIDSAERNTPERAPLPVFRVDPEYPAGANSDASVILCAAINVRGELDSVKVLRGLAPFTSAATGALNRWRFEPARHLGANVDSIAIVVFTFAQPLISSHAPSSRPSP